MDLLTIKDLLNNAKEYKSSSNYYFQMHQCSGTDDNIKVAMDYTLKTDLNDKIVRFGVCEYCQTLFYHDDFESNGF